MSVWKKDSLMTNYPSSITPRQAHDAVVKDNAFLLDVRLGFEYNATHAADVAVNIPLQDLLLRAGELPKDRPILTICAGGHRSRMAANLLKSIGFSNVASVEGGTTAWKQADLPVVQNSRVMALDEQFRLIVGIMVVLFTLLGALRSKKFLIGTGFIGTMLTITAILGICPMMDVLRALPWNKTPQS